MPTLFTGHMSGVNWIPAWALGEGGGDERFRVVTGGQVVQSRLGELVLPTQRCAGAGSARARAAAALAATRAVGLGPGQRKFELLVPPTKAHARDWLERMTDAIRGADAGA